MILYHGSYLEIPKPDLIHSRANVAIKLNLLHFEGSETV